MMKFLRWGFDHDNFGVTLVFLLCSAIIAFVWVGILVGSALAQQWPLFIIALSPIGYAIIEVYRIWKKDHDDGL